MHSFGLRDSASEFMDTHNEGYGRSTRQNKPPRTLLNRVGAPSDARYRIKFSRFAFLLPDILQQ